MLIQKTFPERSRLGDHLYDLRLTLRSRLDQFRGYPRLLKMAEKRLGYRPDIHNPKTYNEKIQWRKVHDRNPLFPVISDKLRLRDYLRDTLGQNAAEAILPRLYLATAKAQTIDFDALPRNLVLKANHASGWNIFLREGEPVDHERVRHECGRWMRLHYGQMKQEWAYQRIPRRIMAEELLSTEDGRVLNDLKFTMFRDQCGYIFMDDDRFGEMTQKIVDEDWQPMNFTNGGLPKGDVPPRPRRFDDMLALARRIGREFDQIRVDFMYADDRIFLNELTLYRGSGMMAFDPPEYDRHFGDTWQLPR